MTSHATLLQRITARPDVFNGKPIVRDMRGALASHRAALEREIELLLVCDPALLAQKIATP